MISSSRVRRRATRRAKGLPGPPRLPRAKRPRASRPLAPFGDGAPPGAAAPLPPFGDGAAGVAEPFAPFGDGAAGVGGPSAPVGDGTVKRGPAGDGLEGGAWPLRDGVAIMAVGSFVNKAGRRGRQGAARARSAEVPARGRSRAGL